MVVALEDAEPTPSHEQTQINTYIVSNYSCMINEGWITASEQWAKKDGERRLGNHRSPLGAEGTVWAGGADVHHCLHLPPLQQGEQGLYLGAWAYLQDHHSEFPATLPRAVCLQIKEANRDISITCTFWLLCREPSNLSSQYSQCCTHLTHSS